MTAAPSVFPARAIVPLWPALPVWLAHHVQRAATDLLRQHGISRKTFFKWRSQYAGEETYDQVRSGARLILTYDAQAKAFFGTVANTTTDPLRRVRIEVHLSNGVAGTHDSARPRPGQTANVNLPAADNRFTTWSAHAEVGEGEHGGSESGERDGEHRD